jgi:Leu/Phe-tRNA-protein transferase
MIDMQLPTPHLLSLGGRLLGRGAFESLLKDAILPDNRIHCPFPRQVIGL